LLHPASLEWNLIRPVTWSVGGIVNIPQEFSDSHE
jgi:hypothetical protein